MNPLALHEIAHQVGDMFDATIKNRVPSKNSMTLMIFNERDGYVISAGTTDIGVLFTVMMDEHFREAYKTESCLSNDDRSAFQRLTVEAVRGHKAKMPILFAFLFSAFASKTKLVEAIAEDLTAKAGIAMLEDRPLYDAILPFTKSLLTTLKVAGHAAAEGFAENSAPLLDLPKAMPLDAPESMLKQFRTLMASDAITNNSAINILSRKSALT